MQAYFAGNVTRHETSTSLFRCFRVLQYEDQDEKAPQGASCSDLLSKPAQWKRDPSQGFVELSKNRGQAKVPEHRSLQA